MGRPAKIDRETLHRLFVIEKKPQKEIATILSVSGGAVKGGTYPKGEVRSEPSGGFLRLKGGDPNG